MPRAKGVRQPPMHSLFIEKIGRSFGAVRALDDVSIEIAPGEVHALMGENGAGKSTLIRILAGLDRPDSGRLVTDGSSLPQGNPAAVYAAGFRFLHQELHIVPGLSVAENMHLNQPYPTRFGIVHWAALNAAAARALQRLSLGRIDPRTPMSSLGQGDQMLVRIAGTLLGQADRPAWLYVMDEPTAALTSDESERLFRVVQELVRQGAGVLYVSHRMPEVLRLCDRISVLRDGRLVSTKPRSDTNEGQIINDMTGRDLAHLFPPRVFPPEPKVPILKVRELRAGPVRSATFDLNSGEVLGISGISGSGRGALLRAILGDIRRETGEIVLGGIALGTGVHQAWANGFSYIPRERRSEGLMTRRSISENMALPHLRRFSRARIFLDHRKQRSNARQMAGRVTLKASSVSQPCDELSGGNQQKVLFARALAGAPGVLLLDEPTRGVDIGARFELYRLIRQASEAGIATVIASSDLPELLGLCDRIGIMRDGELAEITEADGMTEAELLTRFYHLGRAGKAA